MKIIFVDDEPMILQGIERMLFDMSDEWEMRFVESGAEALVSLEKDSADVIVTDMRMPGMDGAALLQEVHKLFPAMVRIVLSGHTELEAALRAVPVAHQFLAKPCQPEILKSVIERACSLQKLLDDKTVRRIVGNIDSLPTVPRIYMELTSALADEDTDTKVIARIISQDIAMTAKVLQLVNSAFFSQANTISTIEQAVVRLGFQMVKNLVLSVEVFKDSESTHMAKGYSIAAEQHHAFKTAALAGKLIKDKHISEDAFMASVLHDIGKLLLANELPEKFERAQSLATENHCELYETEKKLFGITHAEIGGYLLGIWGLPYPIVEAVMHHHEPTRVPERTEFGVLEAVYVANSLANETEIDVTCLDGMGVQDKIDMWQEMATGLAAA